MQLTIRKDGKYVYRLLITSAQGTNYNLARVLRQLAHWLLIRGFLSLSVLRS